MQKSKASKANNDNFVTTEEEQDRQSAAERRRENRRRRRCDGYVHLPAVGWYCRRLKTRRETDNTKNLF